MAEIDKLLGRPLRLVPCVPQKAEECEDPATDSKEDEKGGKAGSGRRKEDEEGKPIMIELFYNHSH